MPPPTTSMRFGNDLSSSAPVESMMRGSSGNPCSIARLAAGGDDALIEVDDLAAAVALDLELVRRLEARRATHDAHLALLRERVETIRELPDDAALPVDELRGVELRFAELDAVRAHLVRFLDDARGVQQCLRRDAADVQADAAERRPALDERDFEPKIGGAETPPCSRRDRRRSPQAACRPAARRRPRRSAAPGARRRRCARRRSCGRLCRRRALPAPRLASAAARRRRASARDRRRRPCRLS